MTGLQRHCMRKDQCRRRVCVDHAADGTTLISILAIDRALGFNVASARCRSVISFVRENDSRLYFSGEGHDFATEHVSGATKFPARRSVPFTGVPLTAPFPFRRPPAPAPAPLTLHLMFWIPLTAQLRSSRFSVRSSPFSAPLTLRLHALTGGALGRSFWFRAPISRVPVVMGIGFQVQKIYVFTWQGCARILHTLYIYVTGLFCRQKTNNNKRNV